MILSVSDLKSCNSSLPADFTLWGCENTAECSNSKNFYVISTGPRGYSSYEEWVEFFLLAARRKK